ncbi:MAG TPA: phage portal protein, partial [Verrucomicrobiae bacterium]|nr:phage portal protein [Verrucomicrobiae bacterium]
MADNATWIDRVIAYVSPAAGARRMLARDYLATYRGAVATRTGNRFDRSSSYRLGKPVDRRALASMRDRARQTYRDNPIGRSLLNTEVDNVIAEGMTLQANTLSKEFNAEAEDRFPVWMEVADIRGMLSGGELQRSIYRASRRDGDVGVVLVSAPGGVSRLQTIPADLICNDNFGPDLPNRVDGVEVDDAASPVAFNILDQDEFGKRKWSRILADDFVFLAHPTEELMVRGETCYSTIFELLHQLDGYVDAVIIAARMAAIFGLIFKEDTASKQYSGLPTLANSQGQQQKAVTLENGMAKYIGSSSDIVQVQAQQP